MSKELYPCLSTEGKMQSPGNKMKTMMKIRYKNMKQLDNPNVQRTNKRCL